MSKLNITKNDKYICFFARDSKYFDDYYHKIEMNAICPRDSNINVQLSALRFLVVNGYKCIRIGSAVTTELEVYNEEKSKIIDYPNSMMQSEKLDLYIQSNPVFTISTGSGIELVSICFRNPVVLVNFVEIQNLHLYNNPFYELFIPKLLWSISEKRLLKFEEILKLDGNKVHTIEYFKKMNLEVIDNREDEIKNTIVEMYQRKEKKYIVNDEIEYYRTKINKTINDATGNSHTSIGGYFALKYKDLA